jgi:hypothetical protein
MNNLESIIEETKNGKMTRKEKLLLGIIAIMDETLQHFAMVHEPWCESKKSKVKLCNCGCDAARGTYVEIEHFLDGGQH